MPEVPSQVRSKLLPSKFMIHEVNKWLFEIGDFPGGSDGKESACSAGDQGSIPGSGDPLEKGMATHSNILAGRIPWTEELGRL